MTRRTLWLVLLPLLALVAGRVPAAEPPLAVWRGVQPPTLTPPEVQAEIAVKMERLRALMAAQGLDGVLLTQVRNVWWITAGTVNNQIVLNKDVGAASLLVLKDGRRWLLCNGSEAGRMMDEGLARLGYQLLEYNWYEANPLKDVRADRLREAAGAGRIGADTDFPGTVNVAAALRPLRFSLTETELRRYRWLGRETAAAVQEVCRRLQPGMDEFEIEAMTAAALRARGIMPTVLLTAVDERIARYRHALPGGAKLKRYAMVNVVAEKWGMPVAATRFVHFGRLPEDLAKRLRQTAIVNARFEAATVPGATCADIFAACREWYRAAGYADEWRKHHQGGATGYDDREYVIYPGIAETVQPAQAFAWNPTITGAKVEDTIVALPGGAEVVTRAEPWPVITVRLGGRDWPQPAILLRDPQTGQELPQLEPVVDAPER